jgi:hypothetical protein
MFRLLVFVGLFDLALVLLVGKWFLTRLLWRVSLIGLGLALLGFAFHSL